MDAKLARQQNDTKVRLSPNRKIDRVYLSNKLLDAHKLYQKPALIDALEEVSAMKSRVTVLNNEW